MASRRRDGRNRVALDRARRAGVGVGQGWACDGVT